MEANLGKGVTGLYGIATDLQLRPGVLQYFTGILEDGKVLGYHLGVIEISLAVGRQSINSDSARENQASDRHLEGRPVRFDLIMGRILARMGHRQ